MLCGLLEDCPHPSGVSAAPRGVWAQQGPLALLVPTSKATHPHPKLSLPKGGNSQCPVVLGTGCERSV